MPIHFMKSSLVPSVLVLIRLRHAHLCTRLKDLEQVQEGLWGTAQAGQTPAAFVEDHFMQDFSSDLGADERAPRKVRSKRHWVQVAA